MDDAFIAALKKQSLNGDIIKQVADDIKIAYHFHSMVQVMFL